MDRTRISMDNSLMMSNPTKAHPSYNPLILLPTVLAQNFHMIQVTNSSP